MKRGLTGPTDTYKCAYGKEASYLPSLLSHRQTTWGRIVSEMYGSITFLPAVRTRTCAWRAVSMMWYARALSYSFVGSTRDIVSHILRLIPRHLTHWTGKPSKDRPREKGDRLTYPCYPNAANEPSERTLPIISIHADDSTTSSDPTANPTYFPFVRQQVKHSPSKELPSSLGNLRAFSSEFYSLWD